MSDDLGVVTASTLATVAVAPLQVSQSLGSVSISAAPTIGMTLTGADLGPVGLSTAITTRVIHLGPTDLGNVALAVGPTVGTPALGTKRSLGTVALVAGPVIAALLPQPGTLANPYRAAQTDSYALDFATALFISAEPTARSGPVGAPSVWYEFTELEVADWLGSTSGFAHGATIEFFTGPDHATAADLTFIGTDGRLTLSLGAVTLSTATGVGVAFTAGSVDLGAVVVDVTPGVGLASLGVGTGIDLGLVTADSLATLVAVLGAGAGLDLGSVTLDETAVLAEVLS